MSWINDLSAYLKKLVLLEKEIEDMTRDLKDMQSIATDHEKRLIRIETMVEMGLRQAPDKLGGR